jgi:hypothetical protein
MSRGGVHGRALALAAAMFVLQALPAAAQHTTRLVLIKADGLAYDILDRFVQQRDPRTGKSVLPWIDYVFYQRGTRLANFYVRGTSLSGPSWSMLDTGQELQIKGNVEFDRYTLHPYDYLNFIPFWIGNGTQHRGDMWGTTVIDELRMPLLLDAFGHDERYQSFQLFQRGSGWRTLVRSPQTLVASRTPKQLFDEWQIGLQTRGMIGAQLEREVIAGLDDPKLRYLDYYTTDFDHATHHNRDAATHLAALQELDGVVGRLWTAIGRSREASTTALVLIADHGVNTTAQYYSQGFNLVHLLGASEGGAHHVVTKRRLMKDYSIKGIYPLVPLITTDSKASTYLKGQSSTYPTALVDFDGNERASLHLRDATLNMLHVLLQQLQRRDLPAAIRTAVIDEVLARVQSRRDVWTAMSSELGAEIEQLHETTRTMRAGQPAIGTPRQQRKAHAGETDEQRDQRLRETGQVETWEQEVEDYGAYLKTIGNLLALTRERLMKRLDVKDYIAPGAMGERNSLYDLQHYVTGPAPGGLVLQADGTLDVERSFSRIDYFSLLTAVRSRNNVQPGVVSNPVDIVAARIPCDRLSGLDGDARATGCIWVDGGPESQALILSRTDARSQVALRYVPVANLSADASGAIHFERRPWQAGFPLRIFEAPDADLPSGAARAAWLNSWHTDEEWTRALHKTHYSNGIVGLYGQLIPHAWEGIDDSLPGLSDSERLRRRYRARLRALVEPDLLLIASDHWNFDVRGFNPGGNHGSFFRASTHATFMLAGGEQTGIRQGFELTDPYDSLSFVPTMLALMGRLDDDNEPDAALKALGFRRFPGRVVREVTAPPSPVPVTSGEP